MSEDLSGYHNPDTSLMRSSPERRVHRRADINGTYHRFLEMPSAKFSFHNPITPLETIVKKSILLAMESPESGEAHRIWNRLIGKPSETKVNLNAKTTLSESLFAKAIDHIRSSTPPPNDAKVIEGHVIEAVALEEPKKKPGRPKKFGPPRTIQEVEAAHQ